MPKTSKPVKRAAMVVDEEVEEREEDLAVAEPPVELDEELESMQKQNIRRRREASRLAGYRKLASDTGITKKSSRGIVKPVMSIADTRRILSFVPEVYKHGSMDADEAKLRIQQSRTPVSTAAAHVFRGLIESELRKVGMEAVDVAASLGRTRVDAAILNVVLSKRKTDFFNADDLPLGMVRYAQAQGLLGLLETEAAGQDQEKATNKALSKAYAESEKLVAAGKAERKASSAAKRAAEQPLEEVQKADRADKAEKVDKKQKKEKVGKAQKTDKTDKTDKADKAPEPIMGSSKKAKKAK
jgi:hypothetical protein